ncbi:RNA polymerase III subunit RPC82 helix-turn-helix domain containing protein [Nitzschia inconspicua]|uniref:DNA-directed RNA polymerase III subunit RPC3 n=1 Tax=Nitzschia inconspicua TaxID=303405 RepID=A0A9K3KBL2_9STRA|nr:RNA polymerase III subunit RPC82 helix-turn-helix domain containing protein [Nitzschia inconspicua]
MTGSHNKPNQFAKFVSTSPLSTTPHDPFLSLASNCVRDYFGPIVQLVADGLMARGESTLPQLISYIQDQCHIKSPQRTSKERQEIMIQMATIHNTALKHDDSSCPSPLLIRASLLVLLQHFLVQTRRVILHNTTTTAPTSNKKRKHQSSSNRKKVIVHYTFDMDRARLFVRYPRYVEYVKKTFGTAAGVLLEELLVHGRLQSVQAIVKTVLHLEREQKRQEEEEDNDDNKDDDVDDEKKKNASSAKLSKKQAIRKQVLESFRHLYQNGYIQRVPLFHKQTRGDDPDDDDDEREFESEQHSNKQKDEEIKSEGPAVKKQKRSGTDTDVEPHDETEESEEDEDPAVVALLQSGPFQAIDAKALWRVNFHMLHDQLRALRLGWLVYERYGSRIDKAGSIVTAGLKIVANRIHAPKSYGDDPRSMDVMAMDTRSKISVRELLRSLPRPVQQLFEQKPGGAINHLYKTLTELSQVNSPKVLMEWEMATEHVADAQFQIRIPSLVTYLKDRIIHQIISDRYDDVSARVCSILADSEYMEAEMIADAAMLPAKDTREKLHCLYRDNYIELFNVNIGKQHNPASMIYLWGFNRSKVPVVVSENVCTALCNMRLRRQHEEEVGRDFIERAKDAGATDENENQADKREYDHFCKGLERLDNAILQLDETLMVLKDF